MKIKFILLSALGLLAYINCHEKFTASTHNINENKSFLSLAVGDTAKTLTEILPNLPYEDKLKYALAMDIFYAKNHPGYVGGFNDGTEKPKPEIVDYYIKISLESDPSLDDLAKLNALVKEYNLDEKVPALQAMLFLEDAKKKLSEMLNDVSKELKFKYARAIEVDYGKSHPGFVGGFDDSAQEASEDKIVGFLKVFLESMPVYDDVDYLEELVKKYDL